MFSAAFVLYLHKYQQIIWTLLSRTGKVTDSLILGVWVSESENCLLTDKTFVTHIYESTLKPSHVHSGSLTHPPVAFKGSGCGFWLRFTMQVWASEKRWGYRLHSVFVLRYIRVCVCVGVSVSVSVRLSVFSCFMLYPSCKFAFVVVLGCFCGLGLVYSNKSCTMPPITFQDLPLNIYMVIFGTGIFVFILSLIFCCYFIRWEARPKS